MKNTIKIITALVFVFGFVGCEEYEDYVKDFEYSGVYFGAQQPLRTVVSRKGNDYMEFRIGVALGGLRENKKGYSAQFTVDPELLNTVEGASKLALLPVECYEIINANNTFVIPPGKFLGDCPVKINKNDFVNLPGSLENTYALPLRLLSTTADSIATGGHYTVIVIKYIDEHSGNYYCKGWEAEWDGTDIIPETTFEYSHVDLSRNKVRTLTTLSTTEFDMGGMGSVNDVITHTDHLLIKLADGDVKLERKSTTTNLIEDRGSSYDPQEKTFTLDYICARAIITTVTVGSGASAINYWAINGTQTSVVVVPGRNPIIDSSEDDFWILEGVKTDAEVIRHRVNEQLKLRQDVEKELRFETWT